MPVETAFDISEEQGIGFTVVSVSGEIDVATSPELHHRLNGAIDGGAELVAVDLLGVTFIDSTALAVLIEASRRCIEAEKTMRLVVSEPRILRIFEITGLTGLFAICASRQEALNG